MLQQPFAIPTLSEKRLMASAIICANTALLLFATPAHADTALKELNKTVVAEDDVKVSTSYASDNATSSGAGIPLSTMETPQSITVFNNERMADQNLRNLADVLAQTAGISVKEYDSARQYYFARGFEISTIMMDGALTLFDPGWGTGENAANTSMYERVEIIKGSTGLTSGAGNPSAAVNLVRKRADSRELSGDAEVGIGSRQQLTATVDVSNALNRDGSIRGRAVVTHEQQDSFREIGDSKQDLIYLTSEMDIAENTLFTLGANLQKNVNNAPTWGGIPAWYADGTRSDYSRSTTTAADWAYWNTTHKNVFAELSHDLNDQWRINARLNRGTNNGDSRLLYVYGNADKDTGTGIFAWTGGNFSTDTSYTMADLFANGTYTLFGREHEASVGLSRAVRDFTAHSANATSVEPIGDFNEWDGKDYPEHVWDDTFLYEKFTDTQTAAIASTRLNLNDSLKGIFGVRVSNQEIDRKAAAYNDAQVIEHNGIVTPYVGVLYDLNEGYTAYASYTGIFLPQQERDVNGDPLDPIEGNSQEIGFKARLADGQLNATAAIFRTKQDNLAAADGSNMVAGTTDQAYKEAEGATSEGYEAELTGALTEQWEIQLGFTSYDVKDADDVKINTEQPRRIFKSYSRYQFSGALSQLTIGGGINWESQSYATTTNPITATPEKVKQDAFALVNLMAKYQLTPELSTQLNINNLTDETYYTNIGNFGQIAYGSPRTVSLSARYEF